MLVADVPIDQVDWPITLAMNAIPDYQEEREIRLNPGTPVALAAVYRSKN